MKRTREKLATVVFDLETTGFRPLSVISEFNKIVQISAYLIESDSFFDSFVNPEMAITERSYKTHKISEFDVEKAPKINEVVKNMWEQLKLDSFDKVKLIAHNCYGFDQIVFERECGDFLRTKNVEFWDTLPWIRENIQYVIDNSVIELNACIDAFNLGGLYEFFYGHPLENAHRSDADVKALARIYMDFIEPFVKDIENSRMRQKKRKIESEMLTKVKFIGMWRAKQLYKNYKIYDIKGIKKFVEKCNNKKKLFTVFKKDLGIKNNFQCISIISNVLGFSMSDKEFREKYVGYLFQANDCVDDLDYYIKYRYKINKNGIVQKPPLWCRYERGLMIFKNKES